MAEQERHTGVSARRSRPGCATTSIARRGEGRTYAPLPTCRLTCGGWLHGGGTVEGRLGAPHAHDDKQREDQPRQIGEEHDREMRRGVLSGVLLAENDGYVGEHDGAVEQAG